MAILSGDFFEEEVVKIRTVTSHRQHVMFPSATFNTQRCTAWRKKVLHMFEPQQGVYCQKRFPVLE